MLTAAQIKLIRSLARKKEREACGLFVVEGEKLVAEALRSGWEVTDVFRVGEIGEKTMQRISLLSTASPALALVRIPNRPAPVHPAKGLFLALDGIRDPGNLGTILRIADWFGIDGVFLSPDTVDPFNPKVVQATMGALFRVPFYTAGIPGLCRDFVRAGGKVYGTFLDGENIYDRALSDGLEAPALIVIGNEANGISPETAAVVTDRLYIPPFPPDDPGSESLNAAVATAVTVAEFRRRQFPVSAGHLLSR